MAYLFVLDSVQNWNNIFKVLYWLFIGDILKMLSPANKYILQNIHYISIKFTEKPYI